MSGKTYRLTVGDITCIVLYEGSATNEPTATALQNAYPNATTAEIDDALHLYTHSSEPSTFNMNVLLIERAGQRILVDTGLGDSARPNFGLLPDALQSEGIRTDDIDTIFITHFHRDHINGLLTSDGSPRYPHSQLITAQAEWDHWMNDTMLAAMGDTASYQNIIEPLRDRFSWLNAGDALVPGVTLIDIAGHTPGHTGLLIEANGERLMFVVDLLHARAQFKYPHWHFAYDTDGELAAQSRKNTLGRAADENLLTLFYHLPFPGLGHVTRVGDSAFDYQPI